MILSVFCGRLIRMVGPSASAAAAAPVVVTNWRRSIPFRLVMDLPSVHCGRRLAAKRGPLRREPDCLSSDRVLHAQGDLRRFLLATRRPCRVGLEILESERVAPGPEAQHARYILVLAPEVSCQARRVRLVGIIEPVKEPRAKVRRELITALNPGARAFDLTRRRHLLGDVGELLAHVLARVHVAVDRELAGGDIAADFDTRTAHIGRCDADSTRVLRIHMPDDVGAPTELWLAVGE